MALHRSECGRYEVECSHGLQQVCAQLNVSYGAIHSLCGNACSTLRNDLILAMIHASTHLANDNNTACYKEDCLAVGRPSVVRCSMLNWLRVPAVQRSNTAGFFEACNPLVQHFLTWV